MGSTGAIITASEIPSTQATDAEVAAAVAAARGIYGYAKKERTAGNLTLNSATWTDLGTPPEFDATLARIIELQKELRVILGDTL